MTAGDDGTHVVDDDLDELVHRADLDGLVRLIDARTASRDWDGLLRVRERSRRAIATGRQVWPAATLAEYRLALLAPPEFVAVVLDESDGLSGRFTIGPLTEVAAQHHTWTELAPLLGRGPRATFVAHERALRGEVVDVDEPAPAIDIPTRRAPWEPSYALADYHDSDADFPTPQLPDDWTEVTLPTAPASRWTSEETDDVEHALRLLVEPWLVASNGVAEVVAVDGDVPTALAALGLRRARTSELAPPTAIAWMAWCGASGGAHGRRRGAASGRYGAWWLLAALGDLLEPWPPSPDELGALSEELRWHRWDAYEPVPGWSLQLAVEDPADGVGWVLRAADES